MDRYGDRDGDGFIEYQRRTPHGLVQQGWKTSSDSVFHADGRIAEGPIALCEVQAYAYAARLLLRGRSGARPRRRGTNAARAGAGSPGAVPRAVRCPELGLYALALDGYKERCRVRASNAGHCLFPVSPRPSTPSRSPERWVRTLSSPAGVCGRSPTAEARYNPMAYHNGSVWPHDNALIAAGLAGSPAKELAVRILSAQLDASTLLRVEPPPGALLRLSAPRG